MRTECELANCLKRAKSVNNQVMTCLSAAFDWLGLEPSPFDLISSLLNDFAFTIQSYIS